MGRAELAIVKTLKQMLVKNGFISDLEEIFVMRCLMRKEGRVVARQQLWKGHLYWLATEPYFLVRSIGDRLPDVSSLANAYEGVFYIELPVGARAWVKESSIDRIVAGPIPLLLEVQRGSRIRINIDDVQIDVRVIRQRVLVRHHFAFINAMGWIVAAVCLLMSVYLVLSR